MNRRQAPFPVYGASLKRCLAPFAEVWADLVSIKRQMAVAGLGLLLLAQFANGVSYLALNADHQAIIAANDDDAGWGIRKTMQTRWWNDNGWAHYGPLYFRINHTVQNWLGSTAAGEELGSREHSEKASHFAIMLVSLFSVYGLAFLLIRILTRDWLWVLPLTGLMAAALLRHPLYAEMVLRAHPDHMFALGCAVAGLLTIKAFGPQGDLRSETRAAAAWGLATSVKLSTVGMAPGFLLLFMPPLSRENLRRLLLFGAVMIAAYLLAGFPQSFNLGRPIRFLLDQSRYTERATISSIGEWGLEFARQGWFPWVILVTVGLLLKETVTELQLKDLRRMNWFWLVSFAFLISRKMNYPSNHYLFPFVSLGLVMRATVLRRARFAERLPRSAVMIILLGAWALCARPASQSLEENLQKQLVCRPEARVVYQKLVEYGKSGTRVWLDPYVPYDASQLNVTANVDWGKTWSSLDKGNFQVLALRRSFYERYLPEDPSAYVKKDVDDWRATREFYLPLDGKAEAMAPTGAHLKLLSRDHCGFEIWQIDRAGEKI